MRADIISDSEGDSLGITSRMIGFLVSVAGTFQSMNRGVTGRWSVDKDLFSTVAASGSIFCIAIDAVVDTIEF
ncbi:hypothetical protein MTX26_26920 [Bradyrhizobium sp. ISRA443]|uniref:hypothetical protein n=1 Tax=unclassified Bradyrhizobium TaxID=2631580 RepID=UPI00247871D2|nr:MULTISPECIES: hypothetical protein [unclassified Bradyrhizobium]WGR97941.1 hypothetical protein MTX23_26915 [Bradyrhizobium sp. ISRA436]WGS04831.1 hypothetical protein MTX18_26925 [Bradyrhizobium sp. ISRA437]WGS11712.1 hypothetical protein MTX26_26920 [Bradyrhizobium sp. ISRA443]